jgi:hypothetical protein
MRLLSRATALILRVMGGATQTQHAGPVLLEPTPPHGSNSSALDTNRQPQPALTQPSLSNDHALSTSTGQKLGSERRTVSVEQVLTAVGSKSQIPARQRLQLAKQARRHVKKVASQIKAAAKRTPEQVPAQTHTASPSGVLGN